MTTKKQNPGRMHKDNAADVVTFAAWKVNVTFGGHVMVEVVGSSVS